LLLFWALASALTLVWGMRQDGGFTNFNSHFNHSLVHLLALTAIASLVDTLPTASPLVGWCALAAAAPVFAISVPFNPAAGSRGDQVAARLHGLLLADPKPAAPKLITWQIPDQDWYEAVTLGRAFQRLGFEFYVHPSYVNMFGKDKGLPRDCAAALSRGEVSVWHVVQRKHAPPGSHVLNDGYAVVFPNAGQPQPLPIRLNFSQPLQLVRPAFGIGPADEGWAWTEGSLAALTFNTVPAAGDVILVFDASGYVTSLTPRGQRVTLRVNGESVASTAFARDRRTERVIVPAELWNRRSPQTIVLELPDAVAPATVGSSADRRELALRLYEFSVESPAR
jgi:hypothetical protein